MEKRSGTATETMSGATPAPAAANAALPRGTPPKTPRSLFLFERARNLDSLTERLGLNRAGGRASTSTSTLGSAPSPFGATAGRAGSVSSSPLRSIQASPAAGGLRFESSSRYYSPTRYYHHTQIGKAALSPFVPAAYAYAAATRSPPRPPAAAWAAARTDAGANDENAGGAGERGAAAAAAADGDGDGPSAVVLSVENEALRAELAGVRRELALAKGYGLSNKELQKRLGDANERVRTLEGMLEDGAAERVREGAVRDESLERAVAAEAALAEKAAECAALRARAEEGEDRQTAARRRASMERQLQESAEKASVYRKELDNITIVLRRYEEENRELRERLELAEGRPRGEPDGGGEELARAREERDELRRRLEEEESTRSGELDSLALRLAERERELRERGRELKERGRMIEQLRADARKREKAMEDEHQKSALEVKPKPEETARLERELEESTRAHAALEGSVRSLQHALDSERGEHAAALAAAAGEADALRARLEETSQAHRMVAECEQMAAQLQLDAAEANERAMAESMEADRLRAKITALEEEILKKSGEVAVLRDSVTGAR